MESSDIYLSEIISIDAFKSKQILFRINDVQYASLSPPKILKTIEILICMPFDPRICETHPLRVLFECQNVYEQGILTKQNPVRHSQCQVGTNKSSFITSTGRHTYQLFVDSTIRVSVYSIEFSQQLIPLMKLPINQHLCTT